MSLSLVHQVARLFKYVRPEMNEGDLMLIDVLGHIPRSVVFLSSDEDFEENPKCWENFFAYLANPRVPLMTIIRAVGAATVLWAGNHQGFLAGVRKFACADGLGQINCGQYFASGTCLGLFFGASLNDNQVPDHQLSHEFLAEMPHVVFEICTSRKPRCLHRPDRQVYGAAVNYVVPWVTRRITSRDIDCEDVAQDIVRLNQAKALLRQLTSSLTDNLNLFGLIILDLLNRTIQHTEAIRATTTPATIRSLVAPGIASDTVADT